MILYVIGAAVVALAVAGVIGAGMVWLLWGVSVIDPSSTGYIVGMGVLLLVLVLGWAARP